VLEHYPDGVWLVELAVLTNPTFVPQAAASVLGVREEAGALLAETLAAYLHERTLLLIFDNCEHLLDAVAQLAYDILQRCPGVHVLATSREPLGITGEVVIRVPALLTQHNLSMRKAWHWVSRRGAKTARSSP
jgi:predicted ATPase